MSISNISLTHNSGEVYLPIIPTCEEAFSSTTHLGVGAHQDDLEFMAMHGILECYDKADRWFGGVTCTNGAGSARTGAYASLTDVQMQEIRAEEQREASRIGKYAFVAQLKHSSAAIKKTKSSDLENDLVEILNHSRPEVVYTHNLADKHSTHVAVVISLLKAIRRLPLKVRPARLIGCEIWRDLDWLSDDKKVVMDLGNDQSLARKLNSVFASQIAGGKRYDLAVEGRRRANATFFDSHAVDASQSVAFGMDLTPLIVDDSIAPGEFIDDLIGEFRNTVKSGISKYCLI